MKVKKLFALVGKVFPQAKPVVSAVIKGDESLDKLADKAVTRRHKLLDKIRKRGRIVDRVRKVSTCLLVALLLAGCQTVRGLREEGYEVSRKEAIELNSIDVIIKADTVVDSVMDYEIGSSRHGESE